MHVQVCFKFCAAEKGDYSSQVSCILNHYAPSAVSLSLNASVDAPHIQLCTPSQWMQRKSAFPAQSDKPLLLHFRDTVVGKSAERDLVAVNDSGVPAHYSWSIGEDRDSAFLVSESSGILAPWDRQKLTCTFAPEKVGSFSAV